MSDILCTWLNQGLRLSKTVNTESLAKDFSSGYLIGEILHKYQLQDDFCLFMKKDTAISKVNNFRRLEPTLKLLGISFGINTAQDLMQGKQGVATHLLHQLYVSLKRKKNAEISRTMMEIMQPEARARLHKKEHEIFSFRLPQVVKRDSELQLQKISQHYEEKCQELTNRSVMAQPIQQSVHLKIQDKKRIRKSEKKQQLMTWNQATKVQVPEPIPCLSSVNIERRQLRRKEREARMVQTEITNFETNQKKLVTYGFASLSSSMGQPLPTDFPPGGTKQGCKVLGSGTELMFQSNSKYIQEIRQRLKERAISCEHRQKRQDRFLEEQLKAREAEQDALQEELLVKRLTRQTKAEQRLAAQLLQIRKEKEVIRQNRLFREQQYQQRREKEFQEALYRESVLAQQAKLAHAKEIREEIEFCKRIAAERAQNKWKKHFESCKVIMEQIVDLATNVGEYRLLTGNLIPAQMVRHWKELLFKGLPLYEPPKRHKEGFESSQDPTELKKQEILNNLDYDEYTKMVGEWAWPEEAGETRLPPPNNDILGHVVQRLRKISHTSVMEPSSPLYPCFTIKACVLGKFCSGNTECMAKISKALGIYVLSADALIEEALTAYKNGEKILHSWLSDMIFVFLFFFPNLNVQEESRDHDKTLSTRARQGAAADREMRKGNAIPNQLLVEIVVEAISQVPAQSGWILDGFPYDITQAQLLNKALGGSVEEENEAVSDRANLVADPDPPEPPPPPAPVLDLVVLLDIPDECVVRRAYSYIDTEAAATSQPTDKTLYLAQISHRITAFQHMWPALEEWFGAKQNILVRVDADVDNEELYNTLESIFRQTMQKKQEGLGPVEDVVLHSVKASDTPPPTTTQPVDQLPVPTDEELGPAKSDARQASPVSESKEEFHGVPTNQHELVSSGVGRSSQDYVDDPLPPEIPQCLFSYWDTVCDSYVNNIKKIMQELRSQRSAIDHQLCEIREGYKQYLGRPDIKQELLSQWQEDFNSIPDDMRDSEDTRAELHLRLDELRERLWDITDKRKEEDEQERAELMCNGWLDDCTFVLLNHHSMLMQVELSRFLETSAILRAYYLSMHRQVPLNPLPKCTYIPLLETPGIKAQDESSDSEIRKNENKDEPAKPSHEKLISDCEEVLKTISELVIQVTAEAGHPEIKENKESLQEDNKASAKAKRAKKEKESLSSQKGDDSVKIQYQDVRGNLFQEYAAALNHEENRAKVRIKLVESHGLEMVHFLQSKAQETFDKMEKWLQAHWLAVMKCIDQLSDVARHHIEAGATLQYELVLEGSDFCINGDHLLVASVAPPPCPPPLEIPVGSTPTIAQLQSLHHQLWSIAPSGVMSSSVFLSLLKDVVSVNMGRNTLPKPWMGKSETQLVQIVSLLTDDYELIDWPRFLLSAALPWPFPSLTQLLDVLGRFKQADVGGTGYINEEQYLKTELWFSGDTVQTVPENSSEPLSFNRLANLRKFFFQLFADHSSCPPQLDYVSMLQYFAADPDPRHGFIRALSVVLGQDLKQPSMDHLVKSLPSIEEATEPRQNSVYQEDESLYASSSRFREQEVSISALLNVICHKVVKMTDSNLVPPGCLSKEEHAEHLVHVYRELGYDPEDSVPFSVLSTHPYTQMLMETSRHFQLVNIHRVLQGNPDERGPSSLTVL
ncbi:sperm flagellar protein 2 [Xenentodon cancila]